MAGAGLATCTLGATNAVEEAVAERNEALAGATPNVSAHGAEAAAAVAEATLTAGALGSPVELPGGAAWAPRTAGTDASPTAAGVAQLTAGAIGSSI